MVKNNKNLKETIKTIVITVLFTGIVSFVAGAYYEYGAYNSIQAQVHNLSSLKN